MRRPPEVEAQLSQLMAGRDADGPQLPETMVHLARQALAQRHQPNAHRHIDARVRQVLEHAEGQLGRQLRGFEASERAEIVEEALGRLAILLLQTDDAADFFEVRFDLALKRLRIDVARHVRRRRAPLVELPEPTELASEPIAEVRQSTLSPEERAMLTDALGRLDERARRAMVLHHLLGVPIASAHGPSVAQQLDVSERTVRNILARARDQLTASMTTKPEVTQPVTPEDTPS